MNICTEFCAEQKYNKKVDASIIRGLDESNLRNILSKAGKLNNEYSELKKTIEILEDTSADIEDLNGKKISLIKQEAYYRLIVDEILNKSKKVITPREFSILFLHYIEYKSWNEIAAILNIDRRYALQIHKTAIIKILAKIKLSA